jgi:hypothetical protein
MATAHQIVTAVIFNVTTVLLPAQSTAETVTANPGYRITVIVLVHIIVTMVTPVITVTVPATALRLSAVNYTTMD